MIKINPMIVTDLQQIRKYIAKDSINNAERMIQRIYAKFETIEQFPNMGTELATRVRFQTDYKYVLCKNYAIFYKTKDDCIEIYRILNTKQDIARIFKK